MAFVPLCLRLGLNVINSMVLCLILDWGQGKGTMLLIPRKKLAGHVTMIL